MRIKKEIFRFSIATPMVGAIDFSVYFISKLFLSIHLAKGLSFASAGIVGYLLNKYWAFSKKKSSYPEMGRYWIGGLVLLIFNVGANWAILNFWPRAVFLALAIASVSTAVLSFIMKKYWVFKCP